MTSSLGQPVHRLETAEISSPLIPAFNAIKLLADSSPLKPRPSSAFPVSPHPLLRRQAGKFARRSYSVRRRPSPIPAAPVSPCPYRLLPSTPLPSVHLLTRVGARACITGPPRRFPDDPGRSCYSGERFRRFPDAPPHSGHSNSLASSSRSSGEHSRFQIPLFARSSLAPPVSGEAPATSD